MLKLLNTIYTFHTLDTQAIFIIYKDEWRKEYKIQYILYIVSYIYLFFYMLVWTYIRVVRDSVF